MICTYVTLSQLGMPSQYNVGQTDGEAAVCVRGNLTGSLRCRF